MDTGLALFLENTRHTHTSSVRQTLKLFSRQYSEPFEGRGGAYKYYGLFRTNRYSHDLNLTELLIRSSQQLYQTLCEQQPSFNMKTTVNTLAFLLSIPSISIRVQEPLLLHSVFSNKYVWRSIHLRVNLTQSTEK